MAVQGHTCKAGGRPSTGRRDLSFTVRGSRGASRARLALRPAFGLRPRSFVVCKNCWVMAEDAFVAELAGLLAHVQKQGLSLAEPLAPDLGELSADVFLKP